MELLKTGDLESWVTTYDVPVTSMIAKPNTPVATTLLNRRATAYIIQLETMRIVWKREGNLAGIGESVAVLGMRELEATYLP